MSKEVPDSQQPLIKNIKVLKRLYENFYIVEVNIEDLKMPDFDEN